MHGSKGEASRPPDDAPRLRHGEVVNADGNALARGRGDCVRRALKAAAPEKCLDLLLTPCLHPLKINLQIIRKVSRLELVYHVHSFRGVHVQLEMPHS